MNYTDLSDEQQRKVRCILCDKSTGMVKDPFCLVEGESCDKIDKCPLFNKGGDDDENTK